MPRPNIKPFSPVKVNPVKKYWLHIATVTFVGLSIGLGVVLGLNHQTFTNLDKAYQELVALQKKTADELGVTKTELEGTKKSLADTQSELDAVKSENQFVKNKTLQEEINNIQDLFKDSILSYEELLKLKDAGVKTQALDKNFTDIVLKLSQRKYTEADKTLTTLKDQIKKEQDKLAVTVAIPANVPAIKEAPASGYRRQSVETSVGTFLVDVIAGDLGSTRVQVETASAGDCRDSCPVDSLASFVSKSGGYAGINGPYFCPAEYPSCAGKTNSFDTLLMNKAKVYFNSDNNVYSSVPAVIFSGNSARFVGASQEWGRDTGVDAVIAAQPMLLSGGEIRFGGDGDPKKGSRGSRSFIGSKGNTVYIGVVRGATVAEVAYVLKTMGLDNALNLDSGGSTALISGGKYLAGPGRNTPFGIVLVRK